MILQRNLATTDLLQQVNPASRASRIGCCLPLLMLRPDNERERGRRDDQKELVPTNSSK
jgi:hypothetical protein